MTFEFCAFLHFWAIFLKSCNVSILLHFCSATGLVSWWHEWQGKEIIVGNVVTFLYLCSTLLLFCIFLTSHFCKLYSVLLLSCTAMLAIFPHSSAFCVIINRRGDSATNKRDNGCRLSQNVRSNNTPSPVICERHRAAFLELIINTPRPAKDSPR